MHLAVVVGETIGDPTVDEAVEDVTEVVGATPIPIHGLFLGMNHHIRLPHLNPTQKQLQAHK